MRDYSKGDHLDIVAGAGVLTYFSVVPKEQFPVDAAAVEKICRVSLLSIAPGLLHEEPFNLGTNSLQVLPGENTNELKFMYFSPASYGTTGSLVTNP